MKIKVIKSEGDREGDNYKESWINLLRCRERERERKGLRRKGGREIKGEWVRDEERERKLRNLDTEMPRE